MTRSRVGRHIGLRPIEREADRRLGAAIRFQDSRFHPQTAIGRALAQECLAPKGDFRHRLDILIPEGQTSAVLPLPGALPEQPDTGEPRSPEDTRSSSGSLGRRAQRPRMPGGVSSPGMIVHAPDVYAAPALLPLRTSHECMSVRSGGMHQAHEIGWPAAHPCNRPKQQRDT